MGGPRAGDSPSRLLPLLASRPFPDPPHPQSPGAPPAPRAVLAHTDFPGAADSRGPPEPPTAAAAAAAAPGPWLGAARRRGPEGSGGAGRAGGSGGADKGGGAAAPGSRPRRRPRGAQSPPTAARRSHGAFACLPTCRAAGVSSPNSRPQRGSNPHFAICWLRALARGVTSLGPLAHLQKHQVVEDCENSMHTPKTPRTMAGA